MHMPKVRHSQSRTIQIRQYEPRVFTFEIEGECEREATEAAMAEMERLVSKKLDASIKEVEAGLAAGKENP